MRTLRLVGLSQDGELVVYVDDTGTEYAAPADERLRVALRGDRARLGQLEIDMESALRPRDIQARIRAGEAPDAVASLAGVPVDRVMPYCVPVLAERQHIAELAGRSHVRRTGAEGAARRLAEVVAEKLRSRSIAPDATEWDAWRRDDGRWSVQASYHSGERLRTAEFVFDTAGRFSIADDDEAKWITGERQQTRKGPQPRETGKPAERRLSAVPDGDDLLSLTDVSDTTETDVPTAFVDDDTEVTQEVPSAVEIDESDDASDDLTAVIRAVREFTPAPDAAEVEPEAAAEAPVDEPSSPRKRRAQGRASVPSWDEIMLGRRSER